MIIKVSVFLFFIMFIYSGFGKITSFKKKTLGLSGIHYNEENDFLSDAGIFGEAGGVTATLDVNPRLFDVVIAAHVLIDVE